MKLFLGMVAAAVGSTVSAFASGNGHGGSGSAAPAVHSSSAPATTSAAAPHSFNGVPRSFNGMPRNYSGPMTYRPTVTYPNGNKTLNYPAVAGSTVSRSTHSNVTNLSNNTRTFRHSAGN